VRGARFEVLALLKFVRRSHVISKSRDTNYISSTSLVHICSNMGPSTKFDFAA
jgi:hypothetical protein